MREIEIEFKNLLTKEQYEKIFDTYDFNDKKEIINKNFYYDDADESFKKAHAALRIRYTNKKNEITLKIKGAKQNVEINVPLDKKYPEEPTVLPILPTEIMNEIERLNLKIKTPLLTQKIETIRYELETEEGLLVLDKTTFLNNIIDYELEFEAHDFEKGKLAFDNLLSSFGITPTPAKPKIARAMEYSKIS